MHATRGVVTMRFLRCRGGVGCTVGGGRYLATRDHQGRRGKGSQQFETHTHFYLVDEVIQILSQLLSREIFSAEFNEQWLNKVVHNSFTAGLGMCYKFCLQAICLALIRKQRPAPLAGHRSEERRVGKECRS